MPQKEPPCRRAAAQPPAAASADANVSSTKNKQTDQWKSKRRNRGPIRSGPVRFGLTLTLGPTGAQRSPARSEGRRADRVGRARSENNAESSNPSSPSSPSPPLPPLPELAQHRPDCRAGTAWFAQPCAPEGRCCRRFRFIVCLMKQQRSVFQTTSGLLHWIFSIQ